MNLCPDLRRGRVMPKAASVAALVAIVVLGAAFTADAQSAAPAPDGKRLYSTICAACHQMSGEGLEEQYPPLDGSEWVVGDESQLVRIILHGLSGPVDVAGQTYSGAMPGWGAMLKDAELAAVATYIRSAWGNKATAVSPANVARLRKATSARTTPWTAAELAQFAK